MFSLIITIVSIALVVALVAATMYSGSSDTMSKGKQQAEVAKSLNELSQIQGALTAYYADSGTYATSIQDLAPKYLSTIPAGWGVEVPSQVAFEASRILLGDETQKLDSCNQINNRLGILTAPPSCADIDSDFAGCCVVPDSANPP